MDLVHVARVGARSIVGQRLRAHELVVGRRGGDDVAVAGDLPRKPRHRPGHCVFGGMSMTVIRFGSETSLSSPPAGKQQLRARTLVYLREEDHAGEARVGVVGDGGVEEKDSCGGGRGSASESTWGCGVKAELRMLPSPPVCVGTSW